MKVVDAVTMHNIDNKTINQIGIPSVVLMENAANAIVSAYFRYAADFNGLSRITIKQKVLIVCGQGNNGGDGLAAARILKHKGIEVFVLFVGNVDRVSGDCKVNLNIVLALNIPILFVDYDNLDLAKEKIENSHVVIDAIFGTGLNSNVSGIFKDIICYINNSSCYCIAVDVPSGINSSNGKVMDVCVQADITVTFGLIKKGLLLFPAALYVGEVILCDIGIPKKIIDLENIMYNVLNSDEARLMLPKRTRRSNKGSFGTVYVIAGSNSMSGACFLSCSACYKSGAGIVNAVSTASVINVIQNKLPQALTTVLPDYNGKLFKDSFDILEPLLKKSDVVILGPGIGVGHEVSQFVALVIQEVTSTIIIDADGLNAIANGFDNGLGVEILHKLNASCIITPHPKEMSRLTGKDVTYILDNIVETALEFARKYNVVVLLKDAHSIIADPDGNVYINTSGNSGLAKAGSGDILTGIIGGFVAGGLSAFNAAVLGSYILGVACEISVNLLGEHSVTSGDILDKIPSAANSLNKV